MIQSSVSNPLTSNLTVRSGREKSFPHPVARVLPLWRHFQRHLVCALWVHNGQWIPLPFEEVNLQPQHRRAMDDGVPQAMPVKKATLADMPLDGSRCSRAHVLDRFQTSALGR